MIFSEATTSRVKYHQHIFLGKEQIKIEIADKNDNSPRFEEPRHGYMAVIPEDADTKNFVVIEVKATDPDSGEEIIAVLFS